MSKTAKTPAKPKAAAAKTPAAKTPAPGPTPATPRPSTDKTAKAKDAKPAPGPTPATSKTSTKPAPGPTPATPASRRAAGPKAAARVQPPIPGIEPTEPAATWEAMKAALKPRVVIHYSPAGVADAVLWLDEREYGPVAFEIGTVPAAPAAVPAAEVVSNPAAPPPVEAPPRSAAGEKPPAMPGELDWDPMVELQVNIKYDSAADLDKHVAALEAALGAKPAAVDPADEDNDFATAYFDCATRVEADVLAAAVRSAPFVTGSLVVDPKEARLSDAELAELDARPRTLLVSPEPRVYCSRCAELGRAPAGLVKSEATGMTCYNCGWPESPAGQPGTPSGP
jgi:hypothetical protein